jgi:hypothetical protein
VVSHFQWVSVQITFETNRCCDRFQSAANCLHTLGQAVETFAICRNCEGYDSNVQCLLSHSTPFFFAWNGVVRTTVSFSMLAYRYHFSFYEFLESVILFNYWSILCVLRFLICILSFYSLFLYFLFTVVFLIHDSIITMCCLFVYVVFMYCLLFMLLVDCIITIT